MALIMFVVVLIVILAFFIMVYNGLIRLKNQCENAFSQIEVQLKRRHDLIPNLVKIAKRYLSHEQDTLSAVINARNSASDIQSAAHSVADDEVVARIANAENLLSKHLRAFNAVVENYPELKADGTMKQVMDELTNTENRIGFARQHYNDSIMAYNNQREVFPNNLISGFFQFGKLMPLEFEDKSDIQNAPKINF